MILEYCPAEDHSTYELETTDPGIVPDGLLLVIQPNEAPVIKLIDTEKVSECVHKNVANRSFETLGATQELCNLIIPEEIQDVLCSGRVQQVLICPESSFSQVPLELLPLRGGQQLGKQCTVVHLSAARNFSDDQLSWQHRMSPLLQQKYQSQWEHVKRAPNRIATPKIKKAMTL